MQNVRNQNVIDRRTVHFPSTTVSVEVLNYKDADGSFRRTECSIDFINAGYSSVLELVRKKVRVPIEDRQISLYVMHAEKVEVRAV